MVDPHEPANTPTLRHALAEQRGLMGWVITFGVFVNLLVLTGPIFALQVYDRVLGSRSVETLVALTILMAFLFLIMGLLDHARRRIAARVGERMFSRLQELAFAPLPGKPRPRPTEPLDDLDILRQFFASGIFLALFDLLWLPFFLAAIALIHPALGWLSLFGATAIMLPGLFNLAFGTGDVSGGKSTGRAAAAWAQLASLDRSSIFGLDMKATLFWRWRTSHQSLRLAVLNMQDKSAAAASVTQTFRWFLQSAIIALGAYLVLQGQLTVGAIIATTVLLARLLAPVDLVSNNTATLRRFSAAWQRLSADLQDDLPRSRKTLAPRPDIGLTVEQLTIFPPGAPRAVLRLVTFALDPGQAIGVTGASGAGKSALANALIGFWPIAGGEVRIGGVPVARIAEANLFAHVGYLPQQLRFHDGTIEENICNFASPADSEAAVRAASRAGAHELITALGDGYQTRLSDRPNSLPGGMLQKIGLARAIFGDPSLLILDEPSTNLDADGLRVLNQIVASTCAAGAAVVVLSQRQAALAGCHKFLLLEHGKPQAYHPRDTAPQHLSLARPVSETSAEIRSGQ